MSDTSGSTWAQRRIGHMPLFTKCTIHAYERKCSGMIANTCEVITHTVTNQQVDSKDKCMIYCSSVESVPDQLIVIKEGCVFDQTEALFHSVNEGLDLQVGHLVQWEEADSSKNIQ